jgi:hypothetical protein
MWIFAHVFLSVLAALGVALSVLEFAGNLEAKRKKYLCICFDRDDNRSMLPDMIIICRTQAEEDEIIKRICAEDKRKVFIKRW